MRKNSLKFKKGLTFIELVVVIGIFATMTSVVLFNFTGFTTLISLQNLANDISLQLKKAQTEALSGKGGAALFQPYKPSYGLHFDIAKPTEFILFADLNNNGVYDPGICGGQVQSASECVDDITIQTGDKITLLSSTACPSKLDISFTRPFPDAVIYADGAKESSVPYAEVEITSPKGAKKSLRVWRTGQIEIKDQKITNSACA